MLGLLLWIIWLIVLLALSYYSSSGILLSPQFGFVGCFIPQAVYAIFYVNKWNLNLSPTTILVLFNGTGIFFIVSIFFSRLWMKKYKIKNCNEEEKNIYVARWKLLIILVIQMIALVMIVFYVSRMPGSSFSGKMAYYNFVSKTVEDGIKVEGLAIPTIVMWFKQFSYFYGFIAIYLLIHSIIYKYKTHNIILICSYLNALILSLLLGIRFDAMALIIASIVQWYFIWGKSRKWAAKLPLKVLMRVILIGIVLVALFPSVGLILGRADERNFVDYIATYLSGQLKNLDIYVRDGNFGCDISNWQTLYSAISFAVNRLGITEWKHFYDQPYHYINGYSLGNVYTVFYWFLHDGGFIALILFTITMAIISQRLFYKAVQLNSCNTIELTVLVYSYVYYGLIFSFFSNRFYSTVVSTNMIKFLLTIYFVKLFFLRIHFKRNFVIGVSVMKRKHSESL